ncbi:glycosyltransferase family 1 protein [Corynebacterium diphtheriae bv. mitis]|nr:glycosyltransferase family 1 protein [Corynebacterium diphtheriae bv. mitis]
MVDRGPVVKVAIVTESYLPNINGVTNSVLRIEEYAKAHGHEVLVIAPRICVNVIRTLPIGLPVGVEKRLRAFDPDVIHLASPYAFAARAAFIAQKMAVPCVAVYQTDVAAYQQHYRLTWLKNAHWSWMRAFHNRAALTLAPSTPAKEQLENHGIKNVQLWGRGVNTELFHPRPKNNPKKVVGYVGRLAPEKSVHRLAALNHRDDLEVVIVGDGILREQLERALPNARFLGQLRGEALACEYARFDVFVHTGDHETFGQTIQEAHASGVPVVAPRSGGPIDLITPANGIFITEGIEQAVDYVLAHDFDPRSTVVTWETVCSQLFAHYRDVVTLDNRGKGIIG